MSGSVGVSVHVRARAARSHHLPTHTGRQALPYIESHSPHTAAWQTSTAPEAPQCGLYLGGCHLTAAAAVRERAGRELQPQPRDQATRACLVGSTIEVSNDMALSIEPFEEAC